MTYDLHLKPTCDVCGSPSDLHGSNCKHMTLCPSCGKTMAENHTKCNVCGASITRLIREYNVRASTSHDRTYYIGRFPAGLPVFPKKKNAENKWSLYKGARGGQMNDALREKYKNKPWLLEDATGQQYQGHLEGSQSANYFLLMMQGKESVAIPAASWYNFNKVAQYKQLTLEEAEEKMKNRRRTADGYERWMMKAANNGPAAFGEVEKLDMGKENGDGGRRKANMDEDETFGSDKGEEDEDEELARKTRLGLIKKNTDDDEGSPKGGHLDFEDDDAEKGDDWEHEEIFTDDDEAVGIEPEERDELAPEVPAPPEIKQDDEDEDEGNEEEGTKLSKSGKELKKLLGKAAGLNESDAEDDDEDEDVEDDEIGLSPVLAPKPKVKDVLKEEPVDTSPSKTAVSSSRGALSQSKPVKAKRKISEDMKPSNGTPVKKVKAECDTKPSPGKEEPLAISAKGAAPKYPSSSSKSGTSSNAGAVTEEEIRAVLMQNAPVTTQDLVAKFKARLRSSEDKSAFADILRRISKIQKTNGPNYVVLRER